MRGDNEQNRTDAQIDVPLERRIDDEGKADEGCRGEYANDLENVEQTTAIAANQDRNEGAIEFVSAQDEGAQKWHHGKQCGHNTRALTAKVDIWHIPMRTDECFEVRFDKTADEHDDAEQNHRQNKGLGHEMLEEYDFTVRGLGFWHTSVFMGTIFEFFGQ